MEGAMQIASIILRSVGMMVAIAVRILVTKIGHFTHVGPTNRINVSPKEKIPKEKRLEQVPTLL
jgi:hypothetical protein